MQPRLDTLPLPQRNLRPDLAAVPSLPEAVRSRLTAAAREVDVTRLPEIPSLPGGLLP
jgi:hypothetical protein